MLIKLKKIKKNINKKTYINEKLKLSELIKYLRENEYHWSQEH